MYLGWAGARSPETISRLFDVLSRETDPKTRLWLTKALWLPYTPDLDRMAVLKAALRDEEVPRSGGSGARGDARARRKGREKLPVDSADA